MESISFFEVTAMNSILDDLVYMRAGEEEHEYMERAFTLFKIGMAGCIFPTEIFNEWTRMLERAYKPYLTMKERRLIIVKTFCHISGVLKRDQSIINMMTDICFPPMQWLEFIVSRSNFYNNENFFCTQPTR